MHELSGRNATSPAVVAGLVGRASSPPFKPQENTVFYTPVPAVTGKHSDRLVVAQTIAPLGNIQSLLGHDPRSPWKNAPAEVRLVYEQVQRKTDKDRKQRLRAYYQDRMATPHAWIGGLPAIAIGIQNPQDFEPYDPKRPEAGVLQVDTAPTNLRIMIDGIGRASAALDMLDDPTVPETVKEVLRKLHIAVSMYMPQAGQTPLTVDEMGQLFHDFNVLQASVGKGMAIDLDKSDVYVRLAERLGVHDVFKSNGGMDQRGSNSPRKGCLVTKITVVKFIRAGVEGPGSHVDHYTDSVATPNLTYGNMTLHEQRLADYLSTIAKQMGSAFNAEGMIHLTTPGWIALGLVYHDIFHADLKVTLTDQEREKFVARIGKIDWSTGNPDFLKFLGAHAVDKATGQPAIDPTTGKPLLRMFGGSKAFYNLAGYIRYRIGLVDLLKEPQFGNPDNFELLLGPVTQNAA